jgi:hypothetical protein
MEESALNQQQQRSGNDYTLGEALSTWQWYALWAILFFTTLAAFPSFPMPHRWRRKLLMFPRSRPQV